MEVKQKDPFAIAADTKILINVIEKALIKDEKEMITYAEMSAAIGGRNVQADAKGLLQTAKKHIQRDNRVLLCTVKNEGLILSTKYNGALADVASRMRRMKRRKCSIVQNAIADKELPPHEMLELMGRLSSLECTDLFTKPNLPKKLCEHIEKQGPKELPTAETMRLFM